MIWREQLGRHTFNVVQVNEGLSENPTNSLDFSMKQDLEQVVRVGMRIAACMAKWVPFNRQLYAPHNACMSDARRIRLGTCSIHFESLIPK